MQTIGFLGLGTMGRPMAGHLLKAGYPLAVARHRSPIPKEILAGGAREHATPRAVAENTEIMITMLPDTSDVEEVLFGEQGVAAGLAPGKVVIDMSSISPTATRSFSDRVRKKGAHYVDAPVSGGEVGAESADLTIMVGADAPVFERVRPVLERMGRQVTLVGDTGAGQVCKVANQIIVALTIEAVAEAFVFAARAGADVARVRAALMGGFASSRILEVHGERMIARAFAPGFRIELHQKDLGLALEGARELGVSLPNTATAQELFNACNALGGAGWDHSALVRALEALAGGAPIAD